MADQGRRIDPTTEKIIRRLNSAGASKTEIAREAKVSRPTAYKYAYDTDENNSENSSD